MLFYIKNLNSLWSYPCDRKYVSDLYTFPAYNTSRWVVYGYLVLYMKYDYLFAPLSPCFRPTTFGGIISKSPLRIQTFVSRAIVIVFSFKELRRLLQMCRDIQKTRSTETLVAGMARKSRAIRAMIGNSVACFWIENIRKIVEGLSKYSPSTTERI